MNEQNHNGKNFLKICILTVCADTKTLCIANKCKYHIPKYGCVFERATSSICCGIDYDRMCEYE